MRFKIFAICAPVRRLWRDGASPDFRLLYHLLQPEHGQSANQRNFDNRHIPVHNKRNHQRDRVHRTDVFGSWRI